MGAGALRGAGARSNAGARSAGAAGRRGSATVLGPAAYNWGNPSRTAGAATATASPSAAHWRRVRPGVAVTGGVAGGEA
jgi:hypothetical protein